VQAFCSERLQQGHSQSEQSDQSQMTARASARRKNAKDIVCSVKDIICHTTAVSCGSQIRTLQATVQRHKQATPHMHIKSQDANDTARECKLHDFFFLFLFGPNSGPWALTVEVRVGWCKKKKPSCLVGHWFGVLFRKCDRLKFKNVFGTACAPTFSLPSKKSKKPATSGA